LPAFSELIWTMGSMVTDQQIRRLMKLRKKEETLTLAAAD